MGELNNSFKPETMRLFVKLDVDGKYHEVEGLNGFSIEEEYSWCNNSDATITIRGFNTHVGEDSFKIEKEFVKKKYEYVTSYFDTYSADDATHLLDIDNAIYGVVTPTGFKLLSKRDRYRDHLPKKVLVSGPCVISFWNDGTKTISRCHDGDEMDVRTGVMLNAIKKWMPGGTYWQDVMDDVTVEYQGDRETTKKPARHPVNHDHPKRPYQRGMSYSDDEKLAALEMMEHMPVTQVSKKTGISLSCLHRWRDMFRSSND